MYCDWPQLGRCCFCMPLRRGVLTFGYIHIFFSAFMICLYSYTTHYAMETEWPVFGRSLFLPEELCLTFFVLELIFDGVLIYGTHMKAVKFVKVYFYYTVVTAVATLIMQILYIIKMYPRYIGRVIESSIFTIAGLCLQIYLLTLVRSLIRKMEISGPHVYDNQLHQIVNGELKVESNGIYNKTTVVPANV